MQLADFACCLLCRSSLSIVTSASSLFRASWASQGYHALLMALLTVSTAQLNLLHQLYMRDTVLMLHNLAICFQQYKPLLPLLSSL